MIVSDFQQAQRTRLLWVYEGLTNYYGWVLASRAGLWTHDDARDSLAIQADAYGTSRGRAWRPLDDTAVANFVILPAPQGWNAYRRSLDYYVYEGRSSGSSRCPHPAKRKGQEVAGRLLPLPTARLAGGKPGVKGYTLRRPHTGLNGR